MSHAHSSLCYASRTDLSRHELIYALQLVAPLSATTSGKIRSVA
jgi:hypothetical protein